MAAVRSGIAVNRRSLLIGAVSAGGMALFGCGGSGSGSTSESGTPLPDTPTVIWDPSPWMWFIAGESRTIDLAVTLPAETVRGGVFGLASGSASLPAGFALSPAGLLTATKPAESQTAKIVFTYTEPGA
jgi:hypothetical protein